jgi:hypothetical protein
MKVETDGSQSKSDTPTSESVAKEFTPELEIFLRLLVVVCLIK